jgi:uncharacterized membrane protein YhfC
MLAAAYLVQLGMMIVVPALAIVVVQRVTKLPWMLAVAGAVGFIGSQVVHIPMLAAIGLIVKLAGGVPDAWKLAFDCAVGGIGAGLCEEWARWLVIAKWRRDARDARSALLMGLGHGGVEAIIVGALVLLTVVNMVVLRVQDPAALGVPPDQLATVQEQVHAFWNAPWYVPLLAGAERWMAMTLHVGNTFIVMLAVVRGRPSLVWLAVLWHAIGNAAVLAAMSWWGVVASEATLLALTPFSVLWAVLAARALRRSQPR